MSAKKSWFGLLAVFVVLTMILSACAPATPAATTAPTAPAAAEQPTTAPAAPAKGHHIALVQFLKGHPVHRLMQLGFNDGCVANKYDCEMLLTDSTNAVDMVPLAEQALAEPVDGVVLYAVDNSFFPTIKKFKDKGIPVVTPHFTSFDQATSGLTAVVGADVVQYAKAAADALGEKLGGKGTVAVTVGSFNETENLVAKSFKEEMAAKYANVKVLDPQEEGFDQAGAIAKAGAIIQGNPDIAGAFSTTGNGPTTWSAAAADNNKKDLVIISMDYTRQNLDLVKSGKVYGLVAQPLYEEFYKAAELVGQAIDGKTVEYKNLLPAPIIFAADLEKYYSFNDRAEAGIAGQTEPVPTATPAPAASTKKHHIALVQFLKGHPVHRLMQLGFSDGCKAHNYDCEMLLTDSTNAVDMVPLAEQALAEPVDGVVLYAVDNSFFPTIKKFKDKGIPVVTPHFTSFDQATSGLTAVVGADVVQYAKAAADAIGEKLGGKGTVAVTVGSFNETENLVAKSFKEEMAAKYANVKVLDPQEEGFDQAGAIAKAGAIIQGNPDIAGAFSTTGNGPTTWSAAAADNNKKDLVIISMDYTRQNLDLVKAGKVYGLVAQPLYEEFYKAAELVGQAIDGTTIEYKNLLPAPIIFAADLEKYYSFNDRAEAGISQ